MSLHLRIVTLLLALSAVACVPQDSFKQPAPTVPADLGDGWIISTPAAENMDEALLNEAARMFFDDAQCANGLALLIVRHGKLVFETYPHDPADRERLHHVRSVTKAIVSLTFGIVRSEGYFPDLDATLSSFMPAAFAAHPDKQAITLRHLLTYRSGIDLPDDVWTHDMYIQRPNDPLEYILARPMSAQPGALRLYKCCDPHLLSTTVSQVTGKSVEQWAAARLFAPIGISRWSWERDATGTTMAGNGLCVAPRDFVRFGLLVMHGGTWEGNPVVPRPWIDQAVYQAGHEFYWWYRSDFSGPMASGYGGQYVLAVPDKDLVIGMISTPTAVFLPPFEALARLIVSSCQ